LLSKSLFVLLMLVLPSLVAEVIVLWVNGISASYILFALPEEVILQTAFFLVPSMLVAALTPNLARLMVAGLASATIFFLIHYAVLASVMSFGEGSRRQPVGVFPGQWPRIFPTSPSGMLVSAILMIGLGATVIVYQYLKRRTVHSTTGATLGMCLVIATVNFWSWDPCTFSEGLPARSGLNPESVKLVVNREPKARGVRRDGDKLTIFGNCEPQGLPQNFLFVLTGLKATLRLSSEKVISSSFDYLIWLFGEGFQIEKEVKVLNEPSPGFERGMTRMLPLLSVDAETFQNYQGTPGTYTSEARLEVYKRLTSSLPLKAGSRYKGDPGETTILSIVPHEGTFLTALSSSKRDGFVVILRESGVRQWLQRTPPPPASYVLRNRTRKEALLGRPSYHPKDIFGRFPALHRLVVNRSPIYFTTAGVPDYHGPVLDEAWLEQAELLRVESRFIGQFSKSVRVENFVLNAR
jgi:hypothetical protein